MQQALSTPSAHRERSTYPREEQDERALRTGRRVQERVRAKRVFLAFLLVLLALSALLFLIVALNISISQKGYCLRQLEEQIQEERKAQESLRLEVAKLESPARIEKIARNNLGMILPSATELVRAGKEHALSMKP